MHFNDFEYQINILCLSYPTLLDTPLEILRNSPHYPSELSVVMFTPKAQVFIVKRVTLC